MSFKRKLYEFSGYFSHNHYLVRIYPMSTTVLRLDYVIEGQPFWVTGFPVLIQFNKI